MATLKTKIHLRRDTAANLKDVKLGLGEPGYATDTKKFVIGDNSTSFSNLKGRTMGPNASTDNALARFDGTSGQVIQDSSVTVDDSGNLTATKLILKSSSDSYVLLGGGGTKALSDFVLDSELPDPTDYYWANVKVSESSSTSTKPTFANNFLVNIATNNVLTPSADWAIASAIPKYLWHDLLPFRAAKAEYSTDGTTWTEDTTDKYRRTLTNQKENQTITVLSDSRPYARFTWDGGSAIWHACQADWLVIGFAYASPAAKCSIKFQYSTDGTTWIDSLTVGSSSYGSAPSWFKINSSFSQCRAVRLVLTRTNDSGSLNLSSVKWLTKRWGNQGMGSELEKPYSWDNNANLYYRNNSSTLGLSSAPWSAIYGTTIYEGGTSLADKYALKTAIPTVNDGVLTLKASDGVTATQKTFTANDADDVTFEVKHAVPTGAAAGSYGPSAGGTQEAKKTMDIVVPYITTDKFGHITSVSNKTFTVTDTDTNTDTKVTQSNTTTANWRKVVLSAQYDSAAGTATTTTTDQVYVTPNIEVQASTGSLRASGTVQMNQLKITSTSMINHIEFARNSWNYIVASGGTSAAFGFVAGGKSASGANSTFAVLGDRVIPGQTDNKIDLGSSDYHFQDFYIKGKIYNGSYNYTLPAKTGTIALTSDIPDVSDFLTSESDTLQTVTTRGNTTTNVVKIQNGAASGAFVLGADVNATTLTANQRKLGRMGIPSYDSTTKTVAGISFDSQANVNLADFGGHPNNTSSIAPDVIRFTVADTHDNKVDGKRTLALQISKQNGLVDSAGGGTSVAAAKFFIPVQTTSSITSNEGFIHGGLTAATGKTRNDYVLLAGGSTKPISDFAMDSEIPDVSDFVTKSTPQTISGNKTFTGNVVTSNNKFEIKANSNTDDSWIKLTNSSDTGYYAFGIRRPYDTYGLQLKIHPAEGSDSYYNIWHAGNDGTGSGLDADKLDGQEGSYYLNYNNLTNKPTIPTVNNGKLTIQRNGTEVAVFTANQASDTTANITDNDTLNTAGSTNDEGKLYLVGTKSQATSAQTYSDAEVYTEGGELNATSVCVAEHGQMKYDSATQCIRFVIN